MLELKSGESVETFVLHSCLAIGHTMHAIRVVNENIAKTNCYVNRKTRRRKRMIVSNVVKPFTRWYNYLEPALVLFIKPHIDMASYQIKSVCIVFTIK